MEEVMWIVHVLNKVLKFIFCDGSVVMSRVGRCGGNAIACGRVRYAG